MNKLVVRVKTSCWSDSKGVYQKRCISYLKRRSVGYNVLMEDTCNIGADEVIPRITNLYDVLDGVYEVVICDEKRDWETGMVDDHNYKLVGVSDES